MPCPQDSNQSTILPVNNEQPREDDLKWVVSYSKQTASYHKHIAHHVWSTFILCADVTRKGTNMGNRCVSTVKVSESSTIVHCPAIKATRNS